MIRSTRRICFASLALVGLGVVTAALAWACSPSAGISVTPSAGPPGTTVTISGAQFTADPVRISLGGGQTLATANGPSFTVTATIPANAPAETHTIIASGPEGTGRAPFTVTGRRPAPGPGSGSGSGTGSSIPTQDGRPEGGGAVEGTADGGVPSDEGRTTRSASGSTTAPAGNRGVATADDPRLAAVAPTLSSGQAVFPDSLAPGSEVAGGRAASRTPGGAPSQRSAAGDLWAGFRSGGSGKLLGADVTAAPQNGGSLPTVSAVLLGLGLATALGGIGIVATCRRSARARAGGQSSF